MIVGWTVSLYFHEIVQENGTTNDVRLSRLQTVNSSKYVDGVGAKDSQQSHVQEVEVSQIDQRPRCLRVNDHETTQQITESCDLSILPEPGA